MTDDAAIPEGVARIRAALEHTRAVGRRLVGLHLNDATELAARSGCHLRMVRRDGKGVPVTLELDLNRINIETEGDIVIESSSG